MSGEVFVYETERATVRIHPGKMSGEEFRTTIEAAARKFYSDIKKSDYKKEIHKNG
jgi:thioredoxin-related protein